MPINLIQTDSASSETNKIAAQPKRLAARRCIPHSKMPNRKLLSLISPYFDLHINCDGKCSTLPPTTSTASWVSVLVYAPQPARHNSWVSAQAFVDKQGPVSILKPINSISLPNHTDAMVRTLCCIGAGDVGGPSMAVMADFCPGVDIHVVDTDQQCIDAWNNLNNQSLPVYEQGLQAVLDRVRGVNLHFSTDIQEAIKRSDMIFLAVNTPTKSFGHGAGSATDLTLIEKAARQIASNANGSTIVVERSTLPVRTAALLIRILSQGNNHQFEVLSNPEFMAGGSAIHDLTHPDRILIGGRCAASIRELTNLYSHWVEASRIITTNLWSAELAKLAANAFLAQRVTSINSIASLCEATGADVNEVRHAIGADQRIGSEFLRPGPGFGGRCFRKDLLSLVYLAEHYGLSEVASYWRSVVELNHWSQKRMSQMIVQALFGSLSDKRIAVLGFAFKANTKDTRDSPAIGICRDLLREQATLSIHDPQVSAEEIQQLLTHHQAEETSTGSVEIAATVLSACRGADAVVILTDWPDYRHLDWSVIAADLRRPAWVFDTRRGIDLSAAQAQGLETWQIGSGQPGSWPTAKASLSPAPAMAGSTMPT